MTEPVVWGEGVAGTGIGLAAWGEATVVSVDWSGGRLHAFGVLSGIPEPWGDGYVHPEGIAIRENEALLTEQAGTLLRQNLLAPGRAGAVVVASGLGAAHGVVWSDDGDTALVVDRAGGRVVEVDLSSGIVRDRVTGLFAPVGLAVGNDGAMYITEQDTGSLTRVVQDGTREAILSGLVSPFLLSWSSPEKRELLVTERAPVHRVGLVDVTDAAPTLTRLVGRGVLQPSQAIVARDRLVITGENGLLSLDSSAGLDPIVRIEIPDGPLWPGAWVDAEIDTGVTGWTRGDLKIVIDPSDRALISESPGTDLNPARPTVRVLAGAVPGDLAIVATDATSGAEVGRTVTQIGFEDFALFDGPPLWMDAAAGAPPTMRTLGLEYGVRDSGWLIQTDDAGAALPAWRLLVVLVDTSDARWPTKVTKATPAPTISDAQTTWRDVVIGPAGLDAFYREMSAGRMGMALATGAVVGPVNLAENWADSFEKDKTSGRWGIRAGVTQKIVTSLQSNAAINWKEVDALYVIVRSSGGDFVWPASTVGKQEKLSVTVDGKSTTRSYASFCIPHDQTTTVKFTNVAVSAHELGHTLGFDDLYMNAPPYLQTMVERDLNEWELMSAEDDLPHLSARNKLMSGYLDQGHVRSFTFGFPDTATIDLVPIASGLPPAGKFSAVELRYAPGQSWFFELRQGVPGKIGDVTGSMAAGLVMGYDTIDYKKAPIVADARRNVILLVDDGDGEGVRLTTLQDYEKLNLAEPADIRTFKLEVVSITPGAAQIKVTVGVVTAPNLTLTPNGGESTDFKSPDIEVRNEVSDAQPEWLNHPMLGMTNQRVVAKVHNTGGLAAPGVHVAFAVLPFNTDDPESARWTELPGPNNAPYVTHDVPAYDTVEFEAVWKPEEDRHWCVQARIIDYTIGRGGVADELTGLDNLAQSNYFQIISKPGSPSSREVSWVDVHNPFDHEVDAVIELSQDSADYRSYIDHRWLHLLPGQTRRVRVEVESKAMSIWDAIEMHWPDGRTWLRSWLPGPGCTAVTGVGVALHARTAVASQLQFRERGPGYMQLMVEGPEGANPPSEGTIILRLEYEDGRTDVLTADIDSNGYAQFTPEPIPGRGTAYFSGPSAYAPVNDWPFDIPV